MYEHIGMVLIFLNILSMFLGFGVKDGSCAEFRQFPEGRGSYVTEGYNNPDYCLYLPDDVEASFPYFLPGSLCPETGYGYWSGQTKKEQDIVLRLSGLCTKPECEVVVNFSGVYARGNATFSLVVNGRRMTREVTGTSRSLVFRTDSFVNGINLVTMEFLGGERVEFDSIEFNGPSMVQALPVGDDPVVTLSLAGYSVRPVGGEMYTPLIMGVRAKSPCRIVSSVSGQNKTEYDVPKGYSEYEVSTAGIRSGSKFRVSVSCGGRELERGTFRTGDAPERMTVDYVDQFMGSSGSRWMIGPGPWMPFGMVKIMPDNEDSHWKAGYEYNVGNIAGFSHIHEWTMAGLLTMPANGPLMTSPGSENNPDAGYRSRIDKESESASVGRYCVHLSDYDIDVAVTATTRASFQKYTFNRADSTRVIVDFHFPMEYWWTVHHVAVNKVSDTRIEGVIESESGNTGYRGRQNYNLNFVMEFDRPVASMNGWKSGDRLIDIDRYDSSVEDSGLWLDFNLGAGETVQVRTGISLVSIENASLNLSKEIGEVFGWDFDAVANNQRKVWQDLFDRVRIDTPELSVKKKFYTNLYRSLSPRTVWNDVNGEWIDMNGEVAKADEGRDVYGGDSLWGTQWNLVPFYSILYPEFMDNWVYTLEQCYNRCGWLPVGNPGMKYIRVMVGSPACTFVASAWQHGIRNFDASRMAEAIIHQQNAVPEMSPSGAQLGNESYPDYLNLGYVPLYDDSWDSDSVNYQSYVSNTMEYAFQDYCAASFLASQGRYEEASEMMRRSSNWKNIFDAESGFVRPRTKDGRWIGHFSPFHAPGFCEGSSWQFTWYVPQDVEGLVRAMGRERFISTLDWGMEQSSKVNFNALGDNFARYPINHGNEPDMQVAYLFDFAGRPDLTQKWVRAVQDSYYGMGERDAYPGDEDQGQMSSWYVMSCLGLFEMTGGVEDDPLICIGSPRVEAAEITLGPDYGRSGKLRISAEGASGARYGISRATLGGREFEMPFLRWRDIKNGGELNFDMR